MGQVGGWLLHGRYGENKDRRPGPKMHPLRGETVSEQMNAQEFTNRVSFMEHVDEEDGVLRIVACITSTQERTITLKAWEAMRDKEGAMEIERAALARELFKCIQKGFPEDDQKPNS